MISICLYTILVIILAPVVIVIVMLSLNILFFVYVTAASRRLNNIDRIYYKELNKRNKKLDKRK